MTDLELDKEIERRKELYRYQFLNQTASERLVIKGTLENLEKEKEKRKIAEVNY